MKTLIAIPCMDTIPTLFMQAFVGMRRVGDVTVSFTVSTLVHNARNVLAKQAVDEGFDRIMWLDSDMVFEPDLMERLSADLDEGRDFVTGIYCKRKPPFTPTIYKDVGLYVENALVLPKAEAFEEYPQDEIFPIDACGFGCVMHSVDLLKQVGGRFGPPFAMLPGFGEDISFCMRLGELGVKMYADSSIKLGHIGGFVVDADFAKKIRGE